MSEPSLRNSDVLSLVARGSSRTVRSLFGGSIALRKALGRALPRGLVVSAIYDGTGGAAKVRLDLADVAALQRLVDAGTLTDKLARQVLEGVIAGEGTPQEVVDARGLAVVSDDGALIAAIDEALASRAQELGVELSSSQHNGEGDLVDAIQAAAQAGFDGILINPAAYTHTSVALRDALLAVALPTVEVHLTNTHAREEFRHISLIADVAVARVMGFGDQGYLYGLDGLVRHLRER